MEQESWLEQLQIWQSWTTSSQKFCSEGVAHLKASSWCYVKLISVPGLIMTLRSSFINPRFLCIYMFLCFDSEECLGFWDDLLIIYLPVILSWIDDPIINPFFLPKDTPPPRLWSFKGCLAGSWSENCMVWPRFRCQSATWSPKYSLAPCCTKLGWAVGHVKPTKSVLGMARWGEWGDTKLTKFNDGRCGRCSSSRIWLCWQPASDTRTSRLCASWQESNRCRSDISPMHPSDPGPWHCRIGGTWYQAAQIEHSTLWAKPLRISPSMVSTITSTGACSWCDRGRRCLISWCCCCVCGRLGTGGLSLPGACLRTFDTVCGW